MRIRIIFHIIYMVCIITIMICLTLIFDWKIKNYIYWIHIIIMLLFEWTGLSFIDRMIKQKSLGG